MKQFFYIARRKDKGNAYYAYFVNPSTGKREIVRSLKKLYEVLHKGSSKRKFTKCEVYEIAHEALERGLIGFTQPLNDEPKLLFADYCERFWDFETSDYIRRKNKEKPNSINISHAKESLWRFRNHVKPYIPCDLELKDFKPYMIERIKDYLLDKGISSSTINKVLCCVRTPLKEAYRLGYIKEDIGGKIINIAVSNMRYGNLTSTEVSSVLRHMDSEYKRGTYERMFFLIVAIAINTGARESEIRALQHDDIEIVNDSLATITISKSYNDNSGIKSTKNGKTNIVPAPVWLCREILEYADMYQQEFIFFNPMQGIKLKVVGARKINEELRKSLLAIGLTKEELQNRKLSFHSLRASYASFLNGNVNDTERMKLMNHSSMSMTMHYTHETQEALSALSKQIQEAIPLAKGIVQE